MLYNIEKLCWDEELLNLFHIPSSLLPKVLPSSGSFGETDPKLFAGAIPICGVAGDQQAALFGQCGFEVGDVKNTYGTGCFLLMNTGNRRIESKNGLLTTIAASTSNEVEYALEGSVFVAGAAVQWLRDGLRLIKSAPQTEVYASRVEDTDGLYVVPSLAGMGAPYWNAYARGTVVGITRGCTKEHFVRATLEGIAYQSFDVIRAMEQDVGVSLNSVKVDGGASVNNMLMQFQADIIGNSVFRPKCVETTALGAAYLAGLACGYWKSKEEIKENWQLDVEYKKLMSDDKREALLKGWKKAVRCALFWAQDEE